jgi:hypothetical protein
MYGCLAAINVLNSNEAIPMDTQIWLSGFLTVNRETTNSKLYLGSSHVIKNKDSKLIIWYKNVQIIS